MATVGIRELKNNLSKYIRRVEAGERVIVTDRGRVIAELSPPQPRAVAEGRSRYAALVAAGLIRPALERGNPLRGFPKLRLPKGTAGALIDADREER